jgi:ABC-2 type transport system ATP-binding protein
MLEIKNIDKYYSSKKILDDISFSVEKGKVFGIIGPNGAGKTTTLRIILGIINPGSGVIKFKGETLDQNFQNFTGYLPEERGLYPKSNVINTLIYLAQLKGLKFSDAQNKANYWLERLKLKEYKKYHIEELSKGNQQKVQFISAIIHEPEILILDEPFSGFDPVNQTIFTQIIQELKPEKYIILSTHLMDLAENLCDDILLINEGKEVISGNISYILKKNDKNYHRIVFKERFDESCLKTNLIESYKINDEYSADILLNAENPSELIRHLSKDYEVVEFKKIIPSLHDIFVSMV